MRILVPGDAFQLLLTRYGGGAKSLNLAEDRTRIHQGGTQRVSEWDRWLGMGMRLVAD